MDLRDEVAPLRISGYHEGRPGRAAHAQQRLRGGLQIEAFAPVVAKRAVVLKHPPDGGRRAWSTHRLCRHLRLVPHAIECTIARLRWLQAAERSESFMWVRLVRTMETAAPVPRLALVMALRKLAPFVLPSFSCALSAYVCPLLRRNSIDFSWYRPLAAHFLLTRPEASSAPDLFV